MTSKYLKFLLAQLGLLFLILEYLATFLAIFFLTTNTVQKIRRQKRETIYYFYITFMLRGEVKFHPECANN